MNQHRYLEVKSLTRTLYKSWNKACPLTFKNSLSVEVSDDGEADDDEDDEGDLIAGTDQGWEGQGIGRRPENVTVNLKDEKKKDQKLKKGLKKQGLWEPFLMPEL